MTLQSVELCRTISAAFHSRYWIKQTCGCAYKRLLDFISQSADASSKQLLPDEIATSMAGIGTSLAAGANSPETKPNQLH